MLPEILKNAKSVCINSVKIMPGDVFVAIKGTKFDGNDFIPNVIDVAEYIVTDKPLTKELYKYNDKVILVESSKLALHYLIEKIYPNIPHHLIAVTGTNGKSSTVCYIRQILHHLGIKAASIGTFGTQKDNDETITSSLTTPDNLTLFQTLNILASDGYNYGAIETSSHGIVQDRLNGLKFKAAGFTSFSQDHLDYHDNMEDYFNSKCKLFEDYLTDDALVVVSMQVFANYPIAEKLKNINYLVIERDIKILELISNLDKQKIKFEYLGEQYSFETNIIGRFQIDNMLIAIFLIHHLGFALNQIVKVIPSVIEAAGRLQKINNQEGFNIFVDYAHTPDALLFVLKELKSLTSGKLFVVFGCGGDRDRSKRKVMGEIAYEYADGVIITDDNPRSEDAASIRREIIQNFSEFIEIASRKSAIEHAISLLKKGDTLIVAGKGHEDYQLIKGEKIYFNDIEVIKSCLKN